ncbi:alcohol dehydrogenase catalytic domain-containing protein [Planosporangium thailandense]|uniref:Alcohol dehydrogenase catalytic domain-containing protein n=1 Tax=Planosporangium thailandense TaxID=765197 RepID=A0ABX0Y5P3_9ACTN|nr:alcohol dehydrogenase catalytic domain-containing protein [Planosporangium thailandense]NJC73421.1 alcohol dehydrogenase catalytic domain-containing protein [Planosporangium thailandense]
MTATMTGAFLPGGSRVEFKQVPVPTPGHGQVLLRVRASTICGSDLRAIYREHLGHGPEAYQGVVGGHEPAGEVVSVGPGVESLQVGARVAVYHISGCGTCADCRMGYQISCTSPARAAYGWQRDGGHAEFMLAEARDCVVLPDFLTYLDGACCACGFGTAYEALCRIAPSGRDRLLIVGTGPVGMAAGLLARCLGVSRLVGVDTSQERLDLAVRLGAIDDGVLAGDDALPALLAATDGGFEATMDCSGSAAGRTLAVRAARRYGRCVLVGEGGRLELDASPDVIHQQLRIEGSWVTSTWRLQELVDNLARWQLHPEIVVTGRYALADAAAAYREADAGASGKIGIVA